MGSGVGEWTEADADIMLASSAEVRRVSRVLQDGCPTGRFFLNGPGCDKHGAQSLGGGWSLNTHHIYG